MVNYPHTLPEFERQFATEEDCRTYLTAIRWADGFHCPRCGGSEAWHSRQGLLVCRTCERKTSVVAGTIFQGTHKELRLWFRAMWWVCSQKNGVSALGIQRVFGLGSYETAWTWMHKLRRSMVRPGRDRLSGTVEIDETYFGGPEAGMHGRKTEKAIVVVAAEKNGKGIGSIRLHCVPDVSATSLLPFIEAAVVQGSTVDTDGWGGYNNLTSMGYIHNVTNIKRSGQLAHELMPRVHRVASLLKRWLLGTHQGGVQNHQLDYYLDEFTFRFNRRTSRSRGQLFYRLIQQAVQVEPAPYKDLIMHQQTTKPRRTNLLQQRG
ncbi:MAG: IS1595 family transposase [Elusimicrobia bacterium]|nr:IS1595 family transposase [Elusimicrobiota bacterium]